MERMQPWNPERDARSSGGGGHGVATIAPGVRVGDYRITGHPSRGGFAAVYRCVSELDGRPAAIKVLDETRHAAPRAVQRFELEVEAIRSIKHPNIVEVYDVGTLPDGRPYYTMEWLEGLSLAEELFLRGPLLPADALPIIEELGAALAAAHEAGVVHRDLKPDNIIALPRGDWFSVKLLDFGIAKLIGRSDTQQGLTTTGTCLGTVFYMAPEQILCDTIDERTDIYALGVLTYRMLTGAIPFRAPHHVAVQMMHLDHPPPRASDRAPAARPWDDVIRRCMAKAPSERPQSIEQVLSELRGAMSRQRVIEARQEVVTIQIEIGASAEEGEDAEDLDSSRWEWRMDALDRAAEAAEAAGWTILVEADDAIIATCTVPTGDEGSATGWSELLEAARRIAANQAGQGVATRVWIRPEWASQPPGSDELSLPAGVYVFRSLLSGVKRPLRGLPAQRTHVPHVPTDFELC